jgi:hypothetical protein
LPLAHGCDGLWSDPSGRLWGQPTVHEHLGRGYLRLIASPWRGSGPSDPSLSKVIGRLACSTVMENLRAAKFAQRLGFHFAQQFHDRDARQA